MVIELREFNDKKKKTKKNTMDKMQQLFFIPWTKVEILCNIWYTDYFQQDLYCKIIKSEIHLKLKARSEFSNEWGEYKNHSNPYTQGATIPSDICRKFTVLAHLTRSQLTDFVIKLHKGTCYNSQTLPAMLAAKGEGNNGEKF